MRVLVELPLPCSREPALLVEFAPVCNVVGFEIVIGMRVELALVIALLGLVAVPTDPDEKVRFKPKVEAPTLAKPLPLT